MNAPNAPKDMRSWIADLEAAGELIRVDKPVDPPTQMGPLLYQSREKAIFFERLSHGWRSLGQAPANVRHAALAFGVPEEQLVPLVAEVGTEVNSRRVNDEQTSLLCEKNSLIGLPVSECRRRRKTTACHESRMSAGH